MKALITGQVGLEKQQYLSRLANLASAQGTEVKVIGVGDTMIKKYQERVDKKTILNLPKALLDLLRRYAWSEISETAGRLTQNQHLVVNSHAVFRWQHGMFPAIDLDLLSSFGPDIAFTLVDDVDEVKKSIEERGTCTFAMWELLAWREEEIWLTRFLVDSLSRLQNGRKIPFFLLPKKQGPELMLRTLNEPKTPKVYLSFPITNLPPSQVHHVREFKARFMKRFIGFDPGAIEERQWLEGAFLRSSEIREAVKPIRKSVERVRSTLGKPRGWGLHWDDNSPMLLAEFDFGKTKATGSEIVSIGEAIDSQIISRDYCLIDQSDFVIMYIAMVRLVDTKVSKPYISAGCQSEMVYAYSKGKPVYVIYPGGAGRLSPWITQYSQVFDSFDQAFEFLSQKYGAA